jgi:hypothetical protein
LHYSSWSNLHMTHTLTVTHHQLLLRLNLVWDWMVHFSCGMFIRVLVLLLTYYLVSSCIFVNDEVSWLTRYHSLVIDHHHLLLWMRVSLFLPTGSLFPAYSSIIAIPRCKCHSHCHWWLIWLWWTHNLR